MKRSWNCGSCETARAGWGMAALVWGLMAVLVGVGCSHPDGSSVWDDMLPPDPVNAGPDWDSTSFYNHRLSLKREKRKPASTNTSPFAAALAQQQAEAERAAAAATATNEAGVTQAEETQIRRAADALSTDGFGEAPEEAAPEAAEGMPE